MRQEECLLWAETQSYHKRHMCAPKLKAEQSCQDERNVLSWPEAQQSMQRVMRDRGDTVKLVASARY